MRHQRVIFGLLMALALGLCCCPDRGRPENERPPRAPDPGEVEAPPAAQPPARPASQPTARPPVQPASQPAAVAWTARTWIFEVGSPGQTPRGFLPSSGRWRLAHDPSAPRGPGVLAQLARSARPVFNLALVEGASYRDLEITVQQRSISGRVDQGGGVVWRARGPRNYYIARYNPLEDNLRVYRVVDGRRKMLASATLRVDHRAWHLLRVRMTGDRIQAFLGDRRYLDVRDATFPGAGSVGLWTKADARTHFDDLVARTLGD